VFTNFLIYEEAVLEAMKSCLLVGVSLENIIQTGAVKLKLAIGKPCN